MKREFVEQDVAGFGKVQATELTVAELAQLSSGGLSTTLQLDALLARHGITTAALNKSLNLDLRDRQVVELRIDDSDCDGCGDCIETHCPVSGYSLSEDKVVFLLSKDQLQGCADCGQCVQVCPQDVFEVVYADYLPSQLNKLVEVFNEVNPDFFLARDWQKEQQAENLAFVKWEIERSEKDKK